MSDELFVRNSPSALSTFQLHFKSEATTDVYAGSGVLDRLGAIIAGLPRAPKQVVLACDAATARLFGDSVETALSADAFDVARLEVPSGETSKSMAHVSEALATLAQRRVDRQALIVAIGGGVVGDLFGFVAACYMRGLRLAHVPTTLVSQVDSSIGGKVGVDLPEGKNLVGAFKHPEFVAIDYDTLRSLPDTEWTAGTAEIVKHGVIADAALFEMLEGNAAAWRARTVDPAPILRAAIDVKSRIVQQDEREQGLRMHLNYGHTPGHAFEAAAAYHGIRHGEAVAWGMALEARIAERLGVCDAAFVRRQDRLLDALGLLRPMPNLDAGSVIDRLSLDKKSEGGKVRWLLPGPDIGMVHVRQDIPDWMTRELITAAVEGTLLDNQTARQ